MYTFWAKVINIILCTRVFQPRFFDQHRLNPCNMQNNRYRKVRRMLYYVLYWNLCFFYEKIVLYYTRTTNNGSIYLRRTARMSLLVLYRITRRYRIQWYMEVCICDGLHEHLHYYTPILYLLIFFLKPLLPSIYFAKAL